MVRREAEAKRPQRFAARVAPSCKDRRQEDKIGAGRKSLLQLPPAVRRSRHHPPPLRMPVVVGPMQPIGRAADAAADQQQATPAGDWLQGIQQAPSGLFGPAIMAKDDAAAARKPLDSPP